MIDRLANRQGVSANSLYIRELAWIMARRARDRLREEVREARAEARQHHRGNRRGSASQGSAGDA
jgi:hypothetical protein